MSAAGAAHLPDPHEPDVNLSDAKAVIDTFDRAAQAYLDSPLRQGAAVSLPPTGRLLMTGDLHDHTLNFQRILKLAALKQRPSNYLIIHELIHGEARINGHDMSIRLLARAAALKLQFPNQVHQLMANHDLAQIAGEGILKNGISVVDAFNAGVEFIYGQQADQVRLAMDRFIRSLPLAVRCPNDIFCSHSLPGPRKLLGFDTSVIDRIPTVEDMTFNGAAYNMVWGRDHDDDTIDALAMAWKTKFFITGHQPADWGYEIGGQNLLILASDHEHGVCLPIDLAETYTMDKLINQIIPLAGVIV